ncbi:MAG: ATP-binding protein [Chitinophagia bacterium]|jgi:ribosomal protein L9
MSTNSKTYEINVDPRILELLGPNLYTNIYYVLAELIANAYDADAKNVYIISSKDSICVEDDGHGMSYKNGDIKNFLNVAGVSRTNQIDSTTRSGSRMKMGRKGVGKLAALSVSESVDVMTITNGERSGFVLARRPANGKTLQAINEDDISFNYVKEQGTSIVMKNPQYRLHKTLNAVKRNLIKIFPLVSQDFVIHIIRGSEEEIINSFDEKIMSELCAIITLGNNYSKLAHLVPQAFPQRRNDLVENRQAYIIPLTLKDNNGQEHEYNLEIAGWIGAYLTTKGRKAELTDFPDNFISLYANKKMGEFNILPIVGENKLIEVFIVGQLHVDLFELSELPDIALSNRQGYKSDDKRYEAVIGYVKNKLLPEIINKRTLYANLRDTDKKRENLEQQKKLEDDLKKEIEKFKEKASKSAAEKVMNFGLDVSKEIVQKAIADSINTNVPDLGIKLVVNSNKKKILISHTKDDKPLSDILYSMMIFNNVPPEDILYTNCDDEISRIPEGYPIYKYLRDFFVESYSTQRIYVLFVTSDNFMKSWGAITEVGAAWITQIDNKIFNIIPGRPQKPLDDETEWHNTNRDGAPYFELWMTKLDADIFCQKIEVMFDKLGYSKKSRVDNTSYLGTLVQIR